MTNVTLSISRAADGNAPEATPEKRSVLVVDDEAENRALYRRMLANLCEVLEAANGEEALEIARKHTLAVVVTDQRMPGMLGTELLERMQDICPNAPKIVVTAYSDMVPVLLAINSCSLFGYLIKPLEATQLRALVSRAIQEYTNRNSLLDMLGRLDAENERLRHVNDQLTQAAKRLAQSHVELRKNCEALEGAYAKMAQLAQRDELTQLRNRRNFIESLTAELARCRRYARTATLIVLEVEQKTDDGKPVDDASLKLMARILANHIRANDLAFRLDEGQFALLLPETADSAARAVCTKLEAAFRASAGLADSLTLAMGLRPVSEALTSADDWYALADAALYDAKERRAQP